MGRRPLVSGLRDLAAVLLETAPNPSVVGIAGRMVVLTSCVSGPGNGDMGDGWACIQCGWTHAAMWQEEEEVCTTRVARSRKSSRTAIFMGFTTSFRMGQLLRYSLKPPRRHPDDDINQYMVVDFVNAVRGCLKAGGYASKEDEGESAGTFLVGYQGRLFKIESDYQVGIPEDGYAAVGSGQDIARGSLFATQGQEPRSRVLTALRSAERFNAGVRGPFHILPESEPQLGKPPLEQDIDRRVP